MLGSFVRIVCSSLVFAIVTMIGVLGASGRVTAATPLTSIS